MYRVETAEGFIDELPARLALAETQSLSSAGIEAKVLDDEGREVSPHILRTIVKLSDVLNR